MLTRKQIIELLNNWYNAWNNHDLDQVMTPFHDDIVFVTWDGKEIRGKKNLRRFWKPWFDFHNDFIFTELETIIDEKQQKVLFRWILDWSPAGSKNNTNCIREKREGVDVLHFYRGMISNKYTYSR